MKIQERYLEYPKRHITPNDTRPYAESSYTCTDLTLNPRSSVFRPQTWLQTEALFGESRLLCDADLGPFTCHSTSFSVFTFTFTFQKLKSGDKDNLSGSGAGPSWYHARKIDSSPQKCWSVRCSEALTPHVCSRNSTHVQNQSTKTFLHFSIQHWVVFQRCYSVSGITHSLSGCLRLKINPLR